MARLALFGLRAAAGTHQGIAERIRRVAMLQDGLAMQPSPMTLARLQELVGDCKHREPAFVGTYYGSAEPPGPRRLVEITAECAFFTHANARRMWKIVAVAATIAFLTVVLALVTAALLGASTALLQLAAKIVIVSFAFWVAGDIATMALSFKSLTDGTDDVLRGCTQALEREQTLEAAQQSALSLFSEYNCAVVKAPPIPAWIYRLYQPRVNDAWRKWQDARHPKLKDAPAA
jgi:hypothetical protein